MVALHVMHHSGTTRPFSHLTLNKHNYNIISRLEKEKHNSKTSHIQELFNTAHNIYAAKADFFICRTGQQSPARKKKKNLSEWRRSIADV